MRDCSDTIPHFLFSIRYLLLYKNNNNFNNNINIIAIYLKKFDNDTEYEEARQNLILPNVSYCVSENEVHYNPYVDPYNGHEYVEIGGLKWATMNVGANSITDTGLYFQWGDTQGYTASQCGSGEGQKYFGWADYKYGNGTSDPSYTGMTKYNSTDDKAVLDASDDAAQTNWGGNWRMPTTEELLALGDAVNTAWTADYQGSGVAGMICTDKTDNSKVLFFPACGWCGDGNVYSVGDEGKYWSSTLYYSNESFAMEWYFYSNIDMPWESETERYSGRTVRAVVG